MLAATTLISLNVCAAFITTRSHRAQTMVEGRAVLIGRNGEIFHDLLPKHHVPLADVERSLREEDCDLKDMRCAFLEADGKISILQKSKGGNADMSG